MSAIAQATVSGCHSGIELLGKLPQPTRRRRVAGFLRGSAAACSAFPMVRHAMTTLFPAAASAPAVDAAVAPGDDDPHGLIMPLHIRCPNRSRRKPGLL
jgi:hypothetical protein